MAEPKYVIDTCSLTEMRRTYPSDVFESAWNLLDRLADVGSLASVDPVFQELTAFDDEVLQWAKRHSNIFLPLDEQIQIAGTRILNAHRSLVDLKKRKSGADPFVIGAAQVHRCAVVTEEKKSGGGGKVKIPDVCIAERVSCHKVLDLFRIEGLKL